MRKKVVGFISVMSMMVALTAGCSEKEPVEVLADTPGVSWAEAEESLLKISEENVARYVSRLENKVATAIELLDKSNGKTNDNNLSRASLSSYLITVEDFMNKSVPDTVEEQVEYRRKAQVVYGELSARIDRVVEEYNFWVEEHDEHLNKIEDVDSLVKGSADSWTDLESKLKANNDRFSDIERERTAKEAERDRLERLRNEAEARFEEDKKRVEEAERERASIESEKNRDKDKDQAEKDAEERSAAEKRAKEQALEARVDYTIIVSGNVAFENGVKTIDTDKVETMLVGDIVKVVDSVSTIYEITYKVDVSAGNEIITKSDTDIIFLYVDENGKTYSAIGKILTP